MKKWRACLCMALAAVVILAGCGKPKSNDYSDAKIADPPITLTYWVYNNMSNAVQNYGEVEAYKELAKRTGVVFEFMHPVGNAGEQLNLLIAARDLPDIIEIQHLGQMPPSPDQAIEDGVVIRLNELIDQYAPNYKKLREQYDEIRRLTTSDKGNVYAFARVATKRGDPWSGIRVRKDLLENLNLDMPETIDEWYETLKAFKNAGIAIPLGIERKGWDLLNDTDAFIGAFGVRNGFYKDDNDIVHYGPIEPGYRDFLATFNKWYAEGLLDKEYFTRDRGNLAQESAAGNVGVNLWSNFGEYEYKAAPYPVLHKGDPPTPFRLTNFLVSGYEAHITTANKYPIETVKRLDYQYSEEGAKVCNWGIEGLNYTMVDGVPTGTPLVINDSLGFGTAMKKYRPDNMPCLLLDQGVVNNDPVAVARAKENAGVWAGPQTRRLPPFTMSDDEKKEFNDIMGPISSFVNQKFQAFITGEESLDKWDTYVSEIKKMGIDRAIEIQQTAYQRYLNR